MGPRSWSLKLSCSRKIPVLRIPIMMLEPESNTLIMSFVVMAVLVSSLSPKN